jgi:uncharacterized membrane protein HdeD (DUF308 family)
MSRESTATVGLDTMSAILAQNWWAVALRGAAAIIFGIIALTATGPAMLSLVLIYGAYMLVDGVFAIVAAVRAARRHDRWGVFVLEGVVSLVAAAVAFLLPGITLIAFVILIAAWAMVSGVVALVAMFRVRRDHGRIWMGISGVCSIILGIALVIAPLLGAIVLTWWIGAYAIISGVSLLVLAFRLRMHRDDATHAGVMPLGA